MIRFAAVSLVVVAFPFLASSTQGGRDSYQWEAGGTLELPHRRAADRYCKTKQARDSPRASVQISWLESDERTTDIDIDYLAIGTANHDKPFNSDVRFGSHHEIHELTFGRRPLIDWWSNGEL